MLSWPCCASSSRTALVRHRPVARQVMRLSTGLAASLPRLPAAQLQALAAAREAWVWCSTSGRPHDTGGGASRMCSSSRVPACYAASLLRLQWVSLLVCQRDSRALLQQAISMRSSITFATVGAATRVGAHAGATCQKPKHTLRASSSSDMMSTCCCTTVAP